MSADRYESTDPQRLISMLPILVYHEVADIGCGPASSPYRSPSTCSTAGFTPWTFSRRCWTPHKSR